METDNPNSQNSKISRKNFLIAGTITGITATTVGLGREVYKKQHADLYETRILSRAELEKVFANSFPNKKPHRISSILGRRPHDEVIARYEAFKSETLSGINTHTRYRYKGTEMNFYYPQNFALTDQESLNAMYEFVKEETGLLVFSRFAPIEKTYIYIGSYGKSISSTMIRDINRQIADSRVNTAVYDRDNNDGFWTEFAQNLLISGRTFDNLALNQEFPANKIGVAAYYVKKGFDYEKYSQTPQKFNLLDKTVTIPHLSEYRYNKLMGIIN